MLLCTVPDRKVAERIAEILVTERLAACVNILPAVTSIYLWQEKLEQSEELLLLIKSRAAVYQQLEQRILALHPYELPEIIAVPIHAGLAGYLRWIEENTG